MREERVQGTGSRRGKEEKGKQKQNWGFSRIPQIHLKFVFLLCKVGLSKELRYLMTLIGMGRELHL
uniref:Uncharacterized protein n=2 Tax=Oryza TaxID=4527 RepID=A0A0E0NE36_ORYRU